MTDTPDYTPPKVWTWTKPSGGRFANINRPIAGPTHEKDLPVGRHPLQLYSLGTPNGVKVTVMLMPTRSPTSRSGPGMAGWSSSGQYGATEFLAVHEYKNVQRWTDMIYERPAVKRGRMVNRLSGEPSSQLHERHDASDFDTKTQDKLAAAN